MPPRLVDCHAHLSTLQAPLNTFAAITCSVGTEIDAELAFVGRTRRSPDNPRRIVHFVGTHPESIASHSADALDRLAAVVRDPAERAARGIGGIGEIGLDFRPSVVGGVDGDGSIKEAQFQVYRDQLALAASVGLPVNVHSRAAGHHALEVRRQVAPEVPALFHAWDGKLKYAVREATNCPLSFFSIAPCVGRSDRLRDLIRQLPLRSLVLETDAPALAPVAGDVNTLDNLAVALRAVQDLRPEEPTVVSRALYNNSMRFLGEEEVSEDEWREWEEEEEGERK